MESTKNHGSQGHTKESSNDSKKVTNQGKTGNQNGTNASGTKVNKNDDDNASSSSSKSGSKNSGSR